MENEIQGAPSQVPPPYNPVTPVEKPKSSTSGIIGTIVIIALIILGGLYFWGKRINTQKEVNALINQEQVASQEAATIETVSTSDETTALEAELNATATSGLGSELE